MNFKKIVLICFCATAFTACKKDDGNHQTPGINDSFENSANGWVGDFADYPLSPDSVKYNLSFGLANLPTPLNVSKKGLRISGKNHSDDLFMYLKKKVSGLKPNTSYRFNFEIALASDAPSGFAGIGGSPGESVYLGVGVSAVEPKKIATGEFYRMNISKITQSQSGTDMKVIGDVGNGTEKTEYKLLKKTGEFVGKTDGKGETWVIVGTDSGFEGTTTLYYTGIKATITELK
jgi:hypothetical protein